MKKLTENLIQQRLKTCTTDLEKVLQINVTGRELKDVSLLKKMTGVEILSLSVNHISSLADFRFCKNLRELYLRHNNITDLNEISYLKQLPKLELLMLSENPCAQNPLYRMTIIKNLKNLLELDGVPITAEERREAQKIGQEIASNDYTPERNENCIPDGPQIQRTPTQSFQRLKSDENIPDKVEPRKHCKTIQEDELELTQTEFPEVFTKTPIIQLNGKKPKSQVIKSEIKAKNSSELKGSLCKLCNNSPEVKHSFRFIPKNTNILSAALNLIKELDYSGLQIINAEVISRLNAFEVDFLCQGQSFMSRTEGINEIMHA